MADSVNVDAANATLNETAGNATAKVPATVEGMAVAYSSLFLMAIIPIFIGSFRSVKHHQEQKVGLFILILYFLFSHKADFVCSRCSDF
jgi:minor histocompatibility antigen H13